MLAVMSAIGVMQAHTKEVQEQRDLLSQVKQKAQQDLLQAERRTPQDMLEAERKAQEGVEERKPVNVTEGGSEHDEVQ